MSAVLGFDPGGAGHFGWCVALDSGDVPLPIVATGLCDHARVAVGAAMDAVPLGHRIIGAGVDAPLMWSRTGARDLDEAIRHAIRRAGAPSPGGTVQQVNSLRGACVAQGLLVALDLQERLPDVPITEAHPKALRWLWAQARAVTHQREDERDAILSAYTAWAMVHQPAGWRDLYALEPGLHSFLPRQVFYYMPVPAG